MKKIILMSALAFGVLSVQSCKPKTDATVLETPDTEITEVNDVLTEELDVDPAVVEQTLIVTGEITAIENGKDGYMATIKDAAGKQYVATISIPNLSKDGGTFKRHEIGETIKVEGTTWNDQEGKTYITVSKLNQ